MSNSVQPHRRQPTRLPRPWDSPGKITGVGCHFLLQFMKVKSEREVAQSCPTLSDPMDCSPPGSSIHGIFQARVLEWGAIAFPSPSSKYRLVCLLLLSHVCVHIYVYICMHTRMCTHACTHTHTHTLPPTSVEAKAPSLHTRQLCSDSTTFPAMSESVVKKHLGEAVASKLGMS